MITDTASTYLEQNHILENPYKGLIPYDEEDAPFFFGRNRDRELIIANLMAWRLTIFYGESGVGKSSVLGAGVTYHLREQAKFNLEQEGSPGLAVVLFNDWKDDPVVALLNAVEKAVTEAWGGRNFAPLPPTTNLFQLLQAWTERLEGELFIILDQFEDYFIYHPQDKGEESFAEQFPQVVNHPTLPVNFLIGIRADAFSKLGYFKDSIPRLFDNLLPIEHLKLAAAREAIEKPLQVYKERVLAQFSEDVKQAINRNGLNPAEMESNLDLDLPPISIEPVLVDTILKEISVRKLGLSETGQGMVLVSEESQNESITGGEEVEAPYLQLVMYRLWETELTESSQILRLSTLTSSLKGVENIINTHVDQVLGGLSASKQEMAAELFRHMVNVDGGKFAQTVTNLAEITNFPETEIEAILEKLSSGVRIIRPVAPPPGQLGGQRYEIFHDVLATPILNWRQRFTADKKAQAAAEEELRLAKAKADEELRLAKAKADEELRLAEQKAQVELLQAEEEKRLAQIKEEGRRKEVRQLITGASVLGVLLVIAITATVIAFIQVADADNAKLALNGALATANIDKQKAQDAAAEAIYNGNLNQINQLITTAHFQLNDRLNLGLLSLKRANNITYTLPNTTPSKVLTGTSEAQRNMFSGLQLDPAVHNVIFLPNTDQDLSSGNCTSQMGHKSGVNTLAFSPNGDTLVSAAFSDAQDDQCVLVWDLNLRKPTLNFERKKVVSLAFSDENHVISGSADGIFDQQELKQNSRNLLTKNDSLNYLAYSPDGKNRAGIKSSEDSSFELELVSLEDSKPVTLTQKLDKIEKVEQILKVVFSADSKSLAINTVNYVLIWSWTSLIQELPVPVVIPVDPSNNPGIAFGPFGNIIARINSDNSSITLWMNLTNNSNILSIKLTSSSPKNIWSLNFSPDGRKLATGSEDGTIQLWNPLNRSISNSTYATGDSSAILSLAFSPNGQTIATGRSDGNIVLWDIMTQPSIGYYLYPSSSTSSNASSPSFQPALAFDPNGHLLSTTVSNTIAAWSDLSSGNPSENLQFLTGYKGTPLSIAVSRDGNSIATGNQDSTVTWWQLISGEWKPTTLLGHTGPVISVAFSPDGKNLASGSSDQTVMLWNLLPSEQPSKLGRPLVGHVAPVTSVTFSPDGKMLASGASTNNNLPDRNIIFWDVETGKQVNLLTTQNSPNDYVNSLTFSPDGNILASGNVSGLILWGKLPTQEWSSISSNEVATHTVKDQGPLVSNIAFNSDGKTLAAIGNNGVNIWDVIFSPDEEFPYPDINVVTNTISSNLKGYVVNNPSSSVQPRLALSPDGKVLAIVNLDRTLLIFDLEKGEPLSLALPLGLTSLVPSSPLLVFSPGGKNAAIVKSDNSIVVSSTISTNLPAVLSGYKNGILSVAFSSDATMLASGDADNEVVLWKINSSNAISQTLSGHLGRVNAVAFNPADNMLLASGSADHSVRIWDLTVAPPRSQLLSRNIRGSVLAVAFNHSGKLLAVVDLYGIGLWEVATRQFLNYIPLLGVTSLTFSPKDENLLVVGLNNDYLNLIDLSDIKQPEIKPYLFKNYDSITGLTFSPDGKLLASIHRDGSMLLWNLTNFPSDPLPFKETYPPIISSVFSPDGNTLFSGDRGSQIIQWDVKSLQKLSDSSISIPSSTSTFIPVLTTFDNGTKVAISQSDNSLLLWDLSANPPTSKRSLVGHSDRILTLANLKDSQELLSLSSDGVLFTWDYSTDYSTLKLTASRNLGKPGITTAAFSSNGNLLALANRDKTIEVWDTNTWKQKISVPLAEHTDKISSLSFSPNDILLALGGDDKSVIIWDLTLEKQINTLNGSTAGVSSLTFSSNGEVLAAGDANGQIILWQNLKSSQSNPKPLTNKPISSPITSLAFSSDDKVLVAGGSGNIIALFNSRSKRKEADLSWADGQNFNPISDVLNVPISQAGSISSLSFRGNNRDLVLVDSNNRSLVVWNPFSTSMTTAILPFTVNPPNPANKLVLSPDGTKLATNWNDATSGYSLGLWNYPSSSLLVSPDKPTITVLPGIPGPVASLAFGEDTARKKQWLAWGSLGRDRRILLWDISNPSSPITYTALPVNYNSNVTSLVFSPDGKYLAGATGATGITNTAAIVLWDMSDLTKPLPPFGGQEGHTKQVNSLAFDPDLKKPPLLASVSEDGTLILWELKTGKPYKSQNIKKSLNSVAFNKDGTLVAAGAIDGSIYVWKVDELLNNTPTNLKPSQLPIGHTKRVISLAFSSDGKTLVSISDDQTSILWEIEESKPEESKQIGKLNLGRFNTSIASIAFHPNLNQLASINTDRSIIIWKLDYNDWEEAACRIANCALQEKNTTRSSSLAKDSSNNK